MATCLSKLELLLGGTTNSLPSLVPKGTIEEQQPPPEQSYQQPYTNHKMLFSHKFSFALKKSVPIFVMIGLGYFEYCYGFRFCYGKLYTDEHRKVTGLALLIIYNIFQLVSFVLWAQIIVIGPGTLNFTVPPYDLLKYTNNNYNNENTDFVDPPDWFLCDDHGLPFWCPNCQSIKILRSHHSSDHTECVPRFDHYCIYIGTVVGLKNYKLFMIFLIVMNLWFIFMFVSVVSFLPGIEDFKGVNNEITLNPNLILLLIGSIFWTIMTGALFVSHVILIKNNVTTVESMQMERSRRNQQNNRFINFKHPDVSGKRIVMDIDSRDHIYDHGFYNNVCDLFGTKGLFLFVPFNIRKNWPKSLDQLIQWESNLFSPQFKNHILQRFRNGEGFEFGKLQH